jgi:hypothetical protein
MDVEIAVATLKFEHAGRFVVRDSPSTFGRINCVSPLRVASIPREGENAATRVLGDDWLRSKRRPSNAGGA